MYQFFSLSISVPMRFLRSRSGDAKKKVATATATAYAAGAGGNNTNINTNENKNSKNTNNTNHRQNKSKSKNKNKNAKQQQPSLVTTTRSAPRTNNTSAKQQHQHQLTSSSFDPHKSQSQASLSSPKDTSNGEQPYLTDYSMETLSLLPAPPPPPETRPTLAPIATTAMKSSSSSSLSLKKGVRFLKQRSNSSASSSSRESNSGSRRRRRRKDGNNRRRNSNTPSEDEGEGEGGNSRNRKIHLGRNRKVVYKMQGFDDNSPPSYSHEENTANATNSISSDEERDMVIAGVMTGRKKQRSSSSSSSSSSNSNSNKKERNGLKQQYELLQNNKEKESTASSASASIITPRKNTKTTTITTNSSSSFSPTSVLARISSDGWEEEVEVEENYTKIDDNNKTAATTTTNSNKKNPQRKNHHRTSSSTRMTVLSSAAADDDEDDCDNCSRSTIRTAYSNSSTHGGNTTYTAGTDDGTAIVSRVHLDDDLGGVLHRLFFDESVYTGNSNGNENENDNGGNDDDCTASGHTRTNHTSRTITSYSDSGGSCCSSSSSSPSSSCTGSSSSSSSSSSTVSASSFSSRSSTNVNETSSTLLLSRPDGGGTHYIKNNTNTESSSDTEESALGVLMSTLIKSSSPSKNTNAIKNTIPQEEIGLQRSSPSMISSANNKAHSLDLVAKLLSGKVAEIIFDASSIVSCGIQTANHVSDALQQSTYLKKVTFSGTWWSSSSSSSSKKKKKQVQQQRLSEVVLKTLLAGLQRNTSVHALVIKDNSNVDRLLGSIVGRFVKTNIRMGRFEVSNCKFYGSGFHLLMLSVQHSTSIRQLCLNSCPNLSGTDIDTVSVTIAYKQLQSVQLSNINLHRLELDTIVFLLQNIQRTATLKELDFSKNRLGDVPRIITLLSLCLSGIDIGTNSIDDNNNIGNNNKSTVKQYPHHIEHLKLIDCRISRSSDLKQITKSLLLDGQVITTLDLSHNKFGDDGAKLCQKLLVNNPKIVMFNMVGCDVTSQKRVKVIADQLRYNNSFLQKIGFSSNVSLAILDSVSTIENVFGGGNGDGGLTTKDISNDNDDASTVGSTPSSTNNSCSTMTAPSSSIVQRITCARF